MKKCLMLSLALLVSTPYVLLCNSQDVAQEDVVASTISHHVRKCLRAILKNQLIIGNALEAAAENIRVSSQQNLTHVLEVIIGNQVSFISKLATKVSALRNQSIEIDGLDTIKLSEGDELQGVQLFLENQEIIAALLQEIDGDSVERNQSDIVVEDVVQGLQQGLENQQLIMELSRKLADNQQVR